jgi:hypothetical protein
VLFSKTDAVAVNVAGRTLVRVVRAAVGVVSGKLVEERVGRADFGVVFEKVLEETKLASEVGRRGRNQLWGKDIGDLVSVEAYKRY